MDYSDNGAGSGSRDTNVNIDANVGAEKNGKTPKNVADANPTEWKQILEGLKKKRSLSLPAVEIEKLMHYDENSKTREVVESDRKPQRPQSLPSRGKQKRKTSRGGGKNMTMGM